MLNYYLKIAPVAQLDRALGYGLGFWVRLLAGAPKYGKYENIFTKISYIFFSAVVIVLLLITLII